MKRLLLTLFTACIIATVGHAQCYEKTKSNAASYAEQGDYDKAIRQLRNGLDKCPDVKGNSNREKELRNLIAQYEKKKKAVEQDKIDTQKERSYLRVDGHNSNFDRNFGTSSGSIFFEVECSDNFEVKDLPNWCFDGGSTSEGFNVYFGENNSTTERSGSFLVSGAGKTIRINITQAGKQDSRQAIISSVSVSHHEMVESKDGIAIRLAITMKGMKDKEARVIAYFYDSAGNALKDKNGQYKTTSGDVSTGTSVTPKVDNYYNEQFLLTIPYEELHLLESQTGSQAIKYDLAVFDRSVTPAKMFYRSEMYTTYADITKTPTIANTLKVNGGTSDQNTTFAHNSDRVRFNVSAPNGSYNLWGVPSWCSIEEKTSSGFTLLCQENINSSQRTDYMEVQTAGQKIRINIKQYGAPPTTTTTATTTTPITYTPTPRYHYRSFNSPRGDLPVVGFSVGYVSKQWAYKANGQVEKFGVWDDSKSVSGLQIGFRIEPLFKYGFGINTGLFYELYYTKTDKLYLQEGTFDGSMMEHSLYLPVHLEYRLHFHRNFQLFFYGGAGLDYGLGGKMKITDPSGYYEDYEVDELYDGGDWFVNWKRFNASLEYGAGFRAGPLQFQFQMTKGLINMSEEDEYDVYLNKNIMATMSIMF